MNRIWVNHCNIHDLWERKKYIEEKRCECWAEKKDINHVLYNCKKYENERKFMFRKIDGRKSEELIWHSENNTRKVLKSYQNNEEISKQDN